MTYVEENNSIQWDSEIESLITKATQHKDQVDLVAFYGSSTLRLWDSMAQDLAPLNTLNLAFGGSTYQDCLYYFKTVFTAVHPRTIVLYCGDNDLAHGQSPRDVIQNLNQLVHSIRIVFPLIKIAVISIKPSPARISLLEEVQRTNALIRSYASNHDLDFIDTFHYLMDGDKPNAELFLEDGLHLNTQGYQLWTRSIRKYLVE